MNGIIEIVGHIDLQPMHREKPQIHMWPYGAHKSLLRLRGVAEIDAGT